MAKHIVAVDQRAWCTKINLDHSIGGAQPELEALSPPARSKASRRPRVAKSVQAGIEIVGHDEVSGVPKTLWGLERVGGSSARKAKVVQ